MARGRSSKPSQSRDAEFVKRRTLSALHSGDDLLKENLRGLVVSNHALRKKMIPKLEREKDSLHGRNPRV